MAVFFRPLHHCALYEQRWWGYLFGDVEHDDSEGCGERLDAEQFLRDLLADGPLPTRQIKADADGAGYSWATVRRAQKSLGIAAIKAGMKGGWTWRL